MDSQTLTRIKTTLARHRRLLGCEQNSSQSRKKKKEEISDSQSTRKIVWKKLIQTSEKTQPTQLTEPSKAKIGYIHEEKKSHSQLPVFLQLLGYRNVNRDSIQIIGIAVKQLRTYYLIKWQCKRRKFQFSDQQNFYSWQIAKNFCDNYKNHPRMSVYIQMNKVTQMPYIDPKHIAFKKYFIQNFAQKKKYKMGEILGKSRINNNQILLVQLMGTSITESVWLPNSVFDKKTSAKKKHQFQVFVSKFNIKFSFIDRKKVELIVRKEHADEVKRQPTDKSFAGQINNQQAILTQIQRLIRKFSVDFKAKMEVYKKLNITEEEEEEESKRKKKKPLKKKPVKTQVSNLLTHRSTQQTNSENTELSNTSEESTNPNISQFDEEKYQEIKIQKLQFEQFPSKFNEQSEIFEKDDECSLQSCDKQNKQMSLQEMCKKLLTKKERLQQKVIEKASKPKLNKKKSELTCPKIVSIQIFSNFSSSASKKDQDCLYEIKFDNNQTKYLKTSELIENKGVFYQWIKLREKNLLQWLGQKQVGKNVENVPDKQKF